MTGVLTHAFFRDVTTTVIGTAVVEDHGGRRYDIPSADGL
jgi:hypothetical protein